MHYAAVWAHTNIVKKLIENGADVCARTYAGNDTALDRVWMSRFVPDTDEVSCLFIRLRV